MARVRAALRKRTALTDRREITVGDLHLDVIQRRVFVAGTKVVLTPTEFTLVHLMARHAGQVLTHRQLLREVWGEAHLDKVQYLGVYVKQLRGKLETEPAKPRRIVTALGVGYRLLGPDD